MSKLHFLSKNTGEFFEPKSMLAEDSVGMGLGF